MADHQSPLIRLPRELRLEIYKLLFNDKNHKTLEIRSDDATTYRLISDVEFHPSIMGVNRQIYDEVSFLLYSRHSFGFGEDIEVIVPFLSNLRRHTRPLIHEISLFKQISIYIHAHSDRCEWTNVCDYLAKNMHLRSLKLIVEGGRPSSSWEERPRYDLSDFQTLHRAKYEALEWVWELLSIQGLQKLEVSSEIRHRPPGRSLPLAFSADFSASIETGLADFLKSKMLPKSRLG
ncbi:hypothetical protein HYFRA_00010488 [Hymenoscyphus fraxineus]|uniref:F-box domain-containing protein n=1 Tax=Hymenoscyphus fraxineus TaxID=746836 RepID=A0A9N9PS54_9HELO|nr:hypothetical protein HYFRA_00010488 [Hymenoscyphus fraxineus]